MLEYDGASGAILRWYAYGLGSNDVLNQINVAAGTRVTLVPDILGSVIGSMDSSSGTLSKIGYLPYGKGASAGPFGFTGQRIDSETGGLYYYRARQYSPAWGRFWQTDPIGYAGGVNLYAYVGNDPINLTDPSGFAADGFNAGFSGILSPNPLNFADTLSNYFGSNSTSSSSGQAGAVAGIAAGIAYSNVSSFLVNAPAAGIGRTVEGAALTGTALSRNLGIAGEEAVRAAYDIGPATRIAVNGGAARIPDGLTSNALSEVKNVSSLSYTQQLRDFSQYAGQNGLQFNLYVRPSTQFTGPLQQAIESGKVNLRFIPGQ